jgi:hypothetical protein
MSAIPSLLDDALGYAGRGWSCFPTAKKKPTVKWGEYQERRPTDEELRRFFPSPGVTGVAVVFGEVSGGLADRDFDTIAGYESFREKNPALARSLPTYRTDRGFQVWFRSDRQRIVNLGDGEFRGAGYSLAPHSRRKRGVYDWTIPLPPGELPEVEAKIFLGDEQDTEKQKAICSVSLYPVSAISVSSPSEIVQRTQPQKRGERNACTLKLARGLKINCGLEKADRKELLPWVKQWYERAFSVIGTKDFETTWLDFLHAFQEAKYPLDLDIVDVAASRVDPDALPEVAQSYDGLTTRRLIGLCWSLASMHPKGHFFLSCHVAAGRMNTTPMTIWKMLRMLRADNVIECLEVGNEYRASRYRWIASTGGGE